jgi:hypothetical protein
MKKDKKKVVGINSLFEGWRPQFQVAAGEEVVESGSLVSLAKTGEVLLKKEQISYRVGAGKLFETKRRLTVDPDFFAVGVELGLVDPTLAKIWGRCMASKQDWIEFEFDEKAMSSQYKVLSKLEQKRVIKRDKNHNIYWLNPRYFGGFNRLKKWETYQLIEAAEAASVIEKASKTSQLCI